MKNPQTFYEIQKEQQWKTYALLLLVWAIYFVGFSLVAAVALPLIVWESGFSVTRFVPKLLQPKMIGGVLGVSFLVALVHWVDAYFWGGQYILGILGARELDPEDTYHERFRNILEEMKLASGLRNVRGMVLPSLATNAFALEDGRGNCVIGVTEGLLGRLTRSQLEAVVAHEFSHIAQHDMFYVTMICALRNVFTRMIEALERMSEDGRKGILIFVMQVVEEMLRWSHALVSRRREYLADATAVEYTRDPLGLAEALNIIGRSNRWVGGVSGLYAPLFIVSSSLTTRSESEDFLSQLFSTHPPTQKRIDILLSMAHADVACLQEEVARQEKERERVRQEVAKKTEQYEQIFAGSERARWLVRKDGDTWEGPFFLEELMEKPWFMLDSWVSRVGSKNVVKASADADIVSAFQRQYGSGQVVGVEKVCPQCRMLLEKTNYEGVPILTCRACGGVFISEDKVRRVLARRDRGFSERLCKKALDVHKQFSYVPPEVKIRASQMEGCPPRLCPRCGVPMLRRGYSYQYFVLIDYCSLCRSYWFDKEELEILQFLVEEESSR
jgi:heat shock protein HtpX